jgi:hypothetical protein
MSVVGQLPRDLAIPTRRHPKALSHPRREMHPKHTKLPTLLKIAKGQQYTPTTHQIVKRKKSMVTISFFGGAYRSLKRSDTVTASKVRACIEMGSLLHSC